MIDRAMSRLRSRGNNTSEIVNAFTVDVEDYFQVSAFDPHIRRAEWDSFPCRVESNTHRFLHLLDAYGVRATFFILGWVAARFPQLVKEIHRRGHEIGSHGYWHRLVYDQSPNEFRQDVYASREILQDIVGVPVSAYRAPSFSITKRSLWALEILVEAGFTVDSSIFPIYHDRYGIPGAMRAPHQIFTAAGPIWEVPASVATFFGMGMPVGGGYFRLYPWHLTRHFLQRINRIQRQPFTFYVHPWEIDPAQPRLKMGSTLTRFRHCIGLAKTEQKLERLLRCFAFAPLRDVIRIRADQGKRRESVATSAGRLNATPG